MKRKSKSKKGLIITSILVVVVGVAVFLKDKIMAVFGGNSSALLGTQIIDYQSGEKLLGSIPSGQKWVINVPLHTYGSDTARGGTDSNKRLWCCSNCLKSTARSIKRS